MKFSTYIFLVALCLASFMVHSSYATDLASPTPTPLDIHQNIVDNSKSTEATPTPVFLASGPPPPTPTPTALYSHGREPSLSELEAMKSEFSLLNRWEVRITDEETGIEGQPLPGKIPYNCHRWAIFGDTSSWFDGDNVNDYNSPLTTGEYEVFMVSRGYELTTTTDPDVEIIVYMDTDENGDYIVTHSAGVYSGNQNLRESKLGGAWRITHPPGALQSELYGWPMYGYKPSTP